ncbi:MAG: nitronate monooxygenase [SAR324 cluster bacterium]|nr:nitronate monooxygenase [SAR324 cluster bacterium]
MWNKTTLSQQLQIDYPIIQAPMAGGHTTPELIAAVSNSGGLGSLGAGYMAPEEIRETVRKIRKLTDKAFSVNLFIPENPQEDHAKINKINKVMALYRQELGLPPLAETSQYGPPFEEQMEVVLEEKVPVFSFTFGLLAKEWIAELKAERIPIMGTATTVKEAIVLEEHGVDMLVAQGSEAGGHRGTFLSDAEDSLIGTFALVPQIVDQIKIPVIAAGSIMDGRGIAAALILGAAGVQSGTVFLTCNESGTKPVHQEALLYHTEEETRLTRVFSGKLARGIKNKFMLEMQVHQENVPDYPIQNVLTQDLRQAAARQELPEYMSLWAGQGLRLCRKISVQELMKEMVAGVEESLHRIK